jgi:hypothetical protein
MSGRSGSLRVATTGADGTFELRNVVARGRVIAQQGNRRSPSLPIAEGIVLALAPTARIDGHIDMHGVPSGRFEIKARPSGRRDHNDDGTVGVVLPDGTFAIVGAPRGRVNVQTLVRDGLRIRVASRDIDVRQPAMRVELDFPHTARRLDVIARNTMSVAHPHSLAIIVTGTHREIEGSQLEGWDGQIAAALALEVDPARLPAAFAKQIDTMSSYATFDIVPDGPISACAVALPTLLADFRSDHLFDVLNKMKLHCTPIEPNDTAVVVDVDPLRRLD